MERVLAASTRRVVPVSRSLVTHVFFASEATPPSWVTLLDEKTVVFEWVQVHTTCLGKPLNPDYHSQVLRRSRSAELVVSTLTYIVRLPAPAEARSFSQAKIITKPRVSELTMSDGRVLVGSARRAVFFASGDFDADFTNYSLLAMYSSEMLHLSTNNGEHCLSDTIRTGDFAPDVSMKRVARVSKSLVSVIFASGGFGADFTQISVLATYMLDLLHFPTTNEEHCTGDAIEMVGPGHSGSPRSWCVLFSTHGNRFAKASAGPLDDEGASAFVLRAAILPSTSTRMLSRELWLEHFPPDSRRSVIRKLP